MPFSLIGRVVFAVGRITPKGVSLLGTAFLLPKAGKFVTASHVTSQDDTNLVIILSKVESLSEYQDTTNTAVQQMPVKIEATDPFRDLCILSAEIDASSNINIAGTDHVDIGENVATFGFPHADFGRMVLTQQITEIGARVLIEASGIKSKHVVLNIQTRPGQSGSPIFRMQDLSLIAVLIGSYAPGGGGGISLGGVDPHTLHQTTHAISAEYLLGMI